MRAESDVKQLKLSDVLKYSSSHEHIGLLHIVINVEQKEDVIVQWNIVNKRFQRWKSVKLQSVSSSYMSSWFTPRKILLKDVRFNHEDIAFIVAWFVVDSLKLPSEERVVHGSQYYWWQIGILMQLNYIIHWWKMLSDYVPKVPRTISCAKLTRY